MRRLARTARPADGGFTLVELLIVITILPLVVGAITAGFITTLQNKDTTITRLTDTHDSQIATAFFVRDVKSAQYVSTSSAPLCGSSSYLVGFAWTAIKSDGSGVTDAAIYKTNGPGEMVRVFCNASGTSTSILTHNTFPQNANTSLTACPGSGFGSGGTACMSYNSGTGRPTQAAVTVTCTDGTKTCANNAPILATPTDKNVAGVSKVELAIKSYASGFNFHVIASPLGWNAAGAGQPGGGTPNNPALDLIGPDATASFSGSPACSLTVNGVAAINNANAGSVTLGSNNGFSATEVYSQSSNPVSGGQSPPVVVGPPLADPYASLPPPPHQGDSPVTTNNSGSLSGQLDGIYILNKGLSLSGNTTLSSKPVASGGHGVLLYVPPSAAAGVDLTGGGNVTLTDVYPGYDGISIWVANGQNVTLGGNGNTTIIGGAVYDPGGSVILNGGGNGGGVNASGIVAKSLSCSGGGNGVGFTTGPLTTSTTVTANPSPANDGQTVTLSAHVTYIDPANGTQNVPSGSGSVVFQVQDKNGNTTTDCTSPVGVGAGGIATCTTGQLSASLSQYKISATYQGTSTYGPSSGSIKESVLEPTSTTVTTSATGLVSGNTASFTATVTAPDGSSPQGTVTFVGVTCTGGNTKTLPTSGPETVTCSSGPLLAAGSPYHVTATYADSSTPPRWQGSTGQTSVAVDVAPTTTSVVSSAPSSKPSQPVTFTATVSPTPDGGSVSWTFIDKSGNTASCSGANYTASPLNNGVASCAVAGGTFSDSSAPYTVKATYSGDASYSGSSGTTTQNVAKIGSKTMAAAPVAGKGQNKQNYTESATVTGNDGGTPTGQVVFYLCANTTSGCGPTVTGATQLPGNLNGAGVATSAQSANLTKNTHYCFAAVYQGDTNYLSSSDLTTTLQCFTA